MSEKQQNKSQNSLDEPEANLVVNKHCSRMDQSEQSKKHKRKYRQSTKRWNVSAVGSNNPSTSSAVHEDSAQQDGIVGTENPSTANSMPSTEISMVVEKKYPYCKTNKEELKTYIRELRCGKLGQREVSALNNLNAIFCSKEEWLIETFIGEKTAVERCVQFMRIELSKKDENETKKLAKERKNLERELQLKSARLLCHVTAGNEQQIKVVVNAGAVEELIGFLKLKKDWEFAEVAVLTLQNIVLRAPSVRNFVFSKGVVSPLVELVAPETRPTLLQDIAVFIEDICGPNMPSPVERKHIMLFLPVVTKLLQMADETVQDAACGVLFRLYVALKPISEKTAKEIIKLGLVERLKNLLDGGNDKVVISSVRVVPLIVESSDLIAKQVFRVGIFPSLAKILTESKNDPIVEIATEAVRYMSTKGAPIVSQLVTAGLVPALVDVKESGKFSAQVGAICALMYIALQNEFVFRHLCEPNSVKTMCAHLFSEDLKAVSAGLTAVGKTLNLCATTKPDQLKNLTGAVKEFKCLDLIKKLQKNNNRSIRKLALALTCKYSFE